jgi:hypothetical protein
MQSTKVDQDDIEATAQECRECNAIRRQLAEVTMAGMCPDHGILTVPMLLDEATARAELMQGDLYRIVDALGIGARAYSGHEAMDRDILPAMEELRARADSWRDLMVDAYRWGVDRGDEAIRAERWAKREQARAERAEARYLDAVAMCAMQGHDALLAENARLRRVAEARG